MLQDISAGRKTEIEFLNGAIVTRAKKLGIDTPYNTFISEQIRFMEALQAEKQEHS
jgi:2-dehydropantoate 2-reductase